MGPGDLQRVLSKLELIDDPRLLVGISGADDAGVVRVSDELALIQTVDFFTPIVDDPYQFGVIAATNALSDVYAMGGQPLAALNIVCSPTEVADLDVLAQIIQGGYSKIVESGAVLAGGHSVSDKELKYGLSVTGVIHPDKIVTNNQAKLADRLVLTKPIGTGILATALKREAIGEEDFEPAVSSMSALNRDAAEIMVKAGVRAGTDVTGFGLLGHALELACASGVGIELESSSVPLFPRVLELAEQGKVPGGTKRNLEHARPHLIIPPALPEVMLQILADAQTSGGLLMCVPPDKLDGLLKDLDAKGLVNAVIGRIVDDHPSRINLL